MESKKAIYDLLPNHFYPKTILLTPKTPAIDIVEIIQKLEFYFPLVAKPNIGERGNAVKKMYSLEDIFYYQQQTTVDFIVQEWCNFENEIGVFYCRYPNEKKGFITGIVKKEFCTIVGNGVDTIEELVLKNDRYFLQYNALKKQIPEDLKIILKKNEEKILIPYGNHCRGTKFLDDSSKIDDTVQETFNNLCSKIPNFYFGRMDIRYQSWELLKQGKNFSIIELNGAGSEPTHIYDPKHSIFFAWREICKHLKIMYLIAKQNKLKQNLSYLSFKNGLALLSSKKNYDKLIKNSI